jgi:hypothetical protein
MITRRETPDGEFDYRYPTPSDVASTITWLATEESASLSGHAFEVTNGMQVPAQSRSKLVSWPDKRLEDLSNQVVLVLGGSESRRPCPSPSATWSGARVVLAFRSLESLGYARSMSAARGMDSVHLLHLEPLRRESADRCFDYIRDHFGRLDGIVVLPRYGQRPARLFPEHRRRRRCGGFRARRDRLAGRLRLGAGDQPGPLGLPQGSAGTHLRHQSQRRSRQPTSTTSSAPRSRH